MVRIKYICEGAELIGEHQVQSVPAVSSIVRVDGKQYEVKGTWLDYQSPGSCNPVTIVDVAPSAAPEGTVAAHGTRQLNG